MKWIGIIFLVLLCGVAKRDSGKIVGQGTSLPVVKLTKPDGGWTVNQMIEVAGTVSDTTIDPITIAINGDRYFLRTEKGSFKRQFPATPGKNQVVVQGTNKAGTGSAERTVYAKIRSLPIMAVLTSDSDGIYTDLHIYEPKKTLKDPFNPGPSDFYHVYWASTSSPTGGVFYLNSQGSDYDRPGYGPYLYTHSSPQIGIYQIDTNYWPSGDHGHTVAYLNLTLFGGTQNEVKRRIKVPLAKPGVTEALAFIRIEKGNKGYIFTPGTDVLPDKKLWPEWVTGDGHKKKKLADGMSEGMAD